MWKSAEITNLAGYLKGMNTNAIKRIAVERALAHGVRVHISQHKNEVSQSLSVCRPGVSPCE